MSDEGARKHLLESAWSTVIGITLTGSAAALAFSQGRTRPGVFLAVLCALIVAVPFWRLLARRRDRPASTMQYAAFLGLLRLTVACAAIAVLMFVLAGFSGGRDPRPFIGFGIVMTFFAMLGAVPTWAAWRKRHSDEPWGTNGP